MNPSSSVETTGVAGRDQVFDNGHTATMREFDVVVIYNGIEKRMEVRANEFVKQVLERAIQTFGPLSNPHLLSLFSASGVELNDNQTILQAGVRPRDKLLLRPSVVKGGCSWHRT